MTTSPTVRRPIPWRTVVIWALIGTLVMFLAVLFHLNRLGGNPVGLIQPGRDGPSASVVQHDFPRTPFPPGVGLDGQQYYVIARNPFQLRADRTALDRPRYRLQHPLYSWTAWLLHPTGGGLGLVYAFAAVGLLAAFGGGVATGALAASWRGPPWLAGVFPILPGVWLSVRVSVADGLAVALALSAIALAARGRHALAVVAGVLAVLTKEPMLVLFAGWAVANRSRRDVALVVAPAAVVIAWMAYLRATVPGQEPNNGDVSWPFHGLWGAWRGEWQHGHQWVGMLCVVLAVALGVTALWKRGIGHPLSWAVAAELAFTSLAGHNPIGESFGAPRTTLALTAVAVLALATPEPRRRVRPPDAPVAAVSAAR